MKASVALASILWAAVVSAQGIPVTYTSAELASTVADTREYLEEMGELAAVQREIEALPQGAQVPPMLEHRRRNVTQKMQLRMYVSDESDRRLIKYLSDRLRKEPSHAWADDWRTMVADAQKRLLREPLDTKNPLSW